MMGKSTKENLDAVSGKDGQINEKQDSKIMQKEESWKRVEITKYGEKQ